MESVAELCFAGQDDNHVKQPVSNLEEALSEVTYVSRTLHGIENGGELSTDTLCDLCARLFTAERRLSALKKSEGRAR